MKTDLGSLVSKVDHYKYIIKNTKEYRAQWEKESKPMIKDCLEHINKTVGLNGKIDTQEQLENLEVIIYNLGKEESGIKEIIPDSDVKRELVKSNGALIFQQMFNGKIMVMITYPHIEGYGEPKPPKNVEIIRPYELSEGFMIRYFEEFINEVTNWEDYDDDAPEQNRIGFSRNPIIMQDDNA